MYSPEIRAYTLALAFLVSPADSDTQTPGIIESWIQFLDTSILKTHRQHFFKIKCVSTKYSSPIPSVMQIGSRIE